MEYLSSNNQHSCKNQFLNTSYQTCFTYTPIYRNKPLCYSVNKNIIYVYIFSSYFQNKMSIKGTGFYISKVLFKPYYWIWNKKETILIIIIFTNIWGKNWKKNLNTMSQFIRFSVLYTLKLTENKCNTFLPPPHFFLLPPLQK